MLKNKTGIIIYGLVLQALMVLVLCNAMESVHFGFMFYVAAAMYALEFALFASLHSHLSEYGLEKLRNSSKSYKIETETIRYKTDSQYQTAGLLAGIVSLVPVALTAAAMYCNQNDICQIKWYWHIAIFFLGISLMFATSLIYECIGETKIAEKKSEPVKKSDSKYSSFSTYDPAWSEAIQKMPIVTLSEETLKGLEDLEKTQNQTRVITQNMTRPKDSEIKEAEEIILQAFKELVGGEMKILPKHSLVHDLNMDELDASDLNNMLPYLFEDEFDLFFDFFDEDRNGETIMYKTTIDYYDFYCSEDSPRKLLTILPTVETWINLAAEIIHYGRIEKDRQENKY